MQVLEVKHITNFRFNIYSSFGAQILYREKVSTLALKEKIDKWDLILIQLDMAIGVSIMFEEILTLTEERHIVSSKRVQTTL